MQHFWRKTELPESLKPDFITDEICDTCKCHRLKHKGGYLYKRASMIFSHSKGIPDCYNEELEKLKTID